MTADISLRMLQKTATVSATDSQKFSQKSYDFLSEKILSGTWTPGEEINRKAIASELGVSLAPVNEAIGQLQVEGFLEITPRKQTRVRLIRREEVRGLLILREAIECQAARLYCGELVRSRMDDLQSLARRVDESQPASAENEQAESDFHGALIGLVGVPVLREEFQKVMRRRLFHMINLIAPWQTQPPLDNHLTLLARLATHDPDEAERAMRTHLERGREGMLSVPR